MPVAPGTGGTSRCDGDAGDSGRISGGANSSSGGASLRSPRSDGSRLNKAAAALRLGGGFGRVDLLDQFVGVVLLISDNRVSGRLHEFYALLADDALHAANGVALAVEQMADAAQERNVIGPVVAPAAAALHRFYFAETAFPKPKHVLRHVEIVGHFADGPECVRRLFHRRPAPF